MAPTASMAGFSTTGDRLDAGTFQHATGAVRGAPPAQLVSVTA